MALVLKRLVPDWRDKAIHESSPCHRGFSAQLKNECRAYVASQFFPQEPLGKHLGGSRNENLECQTFPDESFDIALSLDVMEHVNNPVKAMRETARTLKTGGYCLFTAPTELSRAESIRCARFREDGSEEILVGEAEYHGNPVNAQGALVTFRYGYDLPELIWRYSGLHVEVARFHDPHHGIIGRMTEVYVCRKLPLCEGQAEQELLSDAI